MRHGSDSFKQAESAEERSKLRETLRKHNNDISNPCVKEQKIAFKCLDSNSYDRDKCTVHFTNYKVCKNFWDHVRTDRRKRGILPHLPTPEEREKAKAEYIHLLK